MEGSKCEYNGATSSQDSKAFETNKLTITQKRHFLKVSAFPSYDDLVETFGSPFDEEQSIKNTFFLGYLLTSLVACHLLFSHSSTIFQIFQGIT